MRVLRFYDKWCIDLRIMTAHNEDHEGEKNYKRNNQDIRTKINNKGLFFSCKILQINNVFIFR